MPVPTDLDIGGRAIPVTGGRRDLDGVATLDRLYLGTGQPQLEIGLLRAPASLAPGKMRQAWRARRAGRAVPVVLVLPVADGFRVCGPEGDPPPVRDLPEEVVVALLRRALELEPDVVVEALRAELARGTGSGGVPGLRIEGLASTHFVVNVLPTRREWARLTALGEPALRREGRDVFASLGYELEATGTQELLLRVDRVPVALAHLYRGAHQFDRLVEGVGAPAPSYVLSRAREKGAPYGLLAAGPIVRLLSGERSAGLGEALPSAAFIEVATDILPPQKAGILGACYAPDALRSGGYFGTVRRDSERFAVGLRARFRDRVYSEVVPALVRGIAAGARAAGVSFDSQLLYRSTMLALFRTLFVLYAEDRSLLPIDNPAYHAHSLTQRIAELPELANPGRFDARKSDLWEDIQRIFGAVAAGHQEWGVPAYDGGLFVDDPETSEDGALLARIRVSNADFGPALHGLAIDKDELGAGKVDFGALGVRHIGNLYEGLLSYEVGIAEEDLAVDRGDPAQPYVPALRGDEIAVRSGEPYMRSPKGGRKASGSYYTPEFVVDRVVQGSVAPAFERHLASLRPFGADSAERMWDFKVCDPAMGSGHFLVSVVDVIAERVEAVLPELPAIGQELERARAAVSRTATLADAAEIAEVRDVDLLRRLVLKRCVYGVDLNPMAVELAQLSMWLHAFVPGLPLSYLGHTLRHGNSLVGLIGSELDALLDAKPTLFGASLRERLESALAPARDIALSGDLELHEVERSRDRQRDLDRTAAEIAPAFDLLAADPLVGGKVKERGHDQVMAILEGHPDLATGALTERSSEAARSLRALHWELAFPEVFLRDRPGFDAIVANPPWEEVTVEELGFFTRYMPGLKSERSGKRQRELIEDYARRHPDVRGGFESASAEAQLMRRYINASFELSGSGDPDLYKAFAERFLALSRDGGAIGVVLPRSAFAAEGSTPFRARLFGNAASMRIDFLLNRSGWVFEDAEPRYTIALVAATKARGSRARISAAGPADRPEAFAHLDDSRVEWAADELAPGDHAVPLVPDQRWADLYRHCYAIAPRFDATVGDWHAVPWAELHMTKDRQSGLLKETGRGWPVWSGDSFDIWKPDHTKPPFVLAPEKGLAELQRKRQRSSVWRSNFVPAVYSDPRTLPQHRARILFRDVSRSTDSRTVRVALAPPEIFAVNTSPSLVFTRADERAEAYVLGVLCSLPLDWLARRRVETHLNYFILNALPVPRPPEDDAIRIRIAALAARLGCIDERYAVFARANGVRHGPLGQAEKADAIAELDALVARLYGISAEQLEIVFADFTEDAVPQVRRAATRRHFEALAR